ncbi:AAA family ATPase [Kribbella sp. NPDC056951]|uniref:AAA family ATPase n=1 Tax=Kribbella sp. NPDC056951 TaxID=3345978 RepID=UPI003641A049
MTDSHNSGQHKDREAAAAEVRRMWQPTPSWTQPDPNSEPAADPAETPEQTPDALSEEFPGDSWSRPAGQAAPWEKQQPQPEPPSQPAPSWTQPAAEPTASWTQPAAEKPDFEDENLDEVDETEAAAATEVEEPSTPEPASPVFGGQSFNVTNPAHGQGTAGQSSTGHGSAAQSSTGQSSASQGWAGQGSSDQGWASQGSAGQGGYQGHEAPQHGGHTAPAPQQSQPLSPAAQHFFPQGIPGQNVPQQRDVSYRTDELMQALPLPREAPAERGVRSVLRLRPGTTERTERIARATAATAFRRPVTIVVANPKGGSGKTPTTLLLAGALGQARGGGVVAWDNNELRGNMHLRTHDTNARSTVTDMLQAMAMLTQPDARLGDVAAYLRHQVAGQYDVLTSATTTYAQIEAKDFDQIHRLLSRFYKVLVIDTGNNEGSSNWREAMKAADALVIPIKWKSLSCAAAVQMLEELDNQGPEAQRLIRRAIIAVSNGPGDINREVEKQLRPYFESRAAAVVDIPTDQHIAAEGPLDHSALQPATRRAGLELAAKVSEQITIALNVPR